MRYKEFLTTAIIFCLTATIATADIALLGSCNVNGQARKVDVSGDYAYVAAGSGGMRVVNVSNPRQPRVVGQYVPEHEPLFLSATVEGNYVYTGDSRYGFSIIDVSDPEHPELLGSNRNGSPHGTVIRDEYAYTGNDGGLMVFDISDPEHPEQVGNCDVEGWIWDIEVIGDYAYVSDGERGFGIIDISNPEEPEIIGHCGVQDRSLGVFVLGDYAYTAARNEGLCIIDVSDPEDPDVVTYIDTPQSAVGVHVVGTHAFVAADRSGLRVIDISNPNNPREVDHYSNRMASYYVKVHGSLAYVADQHNGLKIFDVSDYAVDGPLIEVSEEELDFEEVGLNLSEELTLTITNVGIEDLTVSEIVIEGDYFSADFEDELVIEPDEEAELTVIFTPEERGEHEATMTIISDDAYEQTPEVSLSGEGVGPIIYVRPRTLDFDEVGIDRSADLELNIRNRGLNDLVISDISLVGEFFSIDFEEEFTIEPRQDEDLTVTFSPVLGIDYADTLIITSNDPDNAEVTVPMCGTGVGAIIVVEPDSMQFGDVGLNQISEMALSICNDGQLDLNVSDIIVEGGFFDVEFDEEFSIEPDHSRDITVTFTPERSGLSV
ncbi:MAG: choice-of-anchor D domain-containing protein, partial [Candidatus Hatepunaea meridiana]|nr:choice-of-anchor D domain-containing protein [Candidatus Hatepunaea meridiana]